MGGPPRPDLFLHELVSQIPLSWNCENHINAYIKTKENEGLFENLSGNKTVRGENLIFEIHLKIGVLKII